MCTVFMIASSISANLSLLVCWLCVLRNMYLHLEPYFGKWHKRYKPFLFVLIISGANIMDYLSRGWSMEYHICFSIPKCSYWSVVLKSSVCHLGKPCITPVFKMASKMAAIS